MLKKTLITSLVLGVALTSSSLLSEAQEPLYDQDGNLILDTPQESYQDLSANDPEVPLVLDDPLDQVTTTTKPDREKVSEVKKAATYSTIPKSTKSAEDVEFGKMMPTSTTYLQGVGGDIISKASLPIKEIKLTNTRGLPEGLWSIVDNQLVINAEKLKQADKGQYAFNVTFTNGTEDIYVLKVVTPSISEDYWNKNLNSFNKNPLSSNHRDLELVSSAQKVDIISISVDGIAVPKESYKVVGGTVIIDKDFLNKINIDTYVNVSLVYNNGVPADFRIDIVNDTAGVQTSTEVGC